VQAGAGQPLMAPPICLKVFEEKISGKRATGDRPALLNALSHIRDGDLLTVQEVDRLGRNLQRGESIRTIAAGVKVSVGVVHKTLAGAQLDTQRGAEGNPR
jgi:hypothetical protein